MARPRQPVELLLVKGKKHLTKAEIDERRSKEVKAPSDKVKAPKYLPKELKTEFNKIAKELVAVNLMTNLDVDALTRFLFSRHEYLRVTDALMETEDQTSREYSDLLLVQDKLFKQCRQSASDLGLTIASRCRLVVPKKETPRPKTEEEQIFGDYL